jgi:UDP-glucose 4-epimerase
MTWMVVGGAGYIGGHTVAAMVEAGREVIVLDDLSTGSEDRVPAGVPLVIASAADTGTVRRAIDKHDVEGVIHLAARKSAPESVANPLLYYRSNVGTTVDLLQAMTDAGVSKIVFSSTAAVYGAPDTPSVTEQTPTQPINPYGSTKLTCEEILRAAGHAHGLSWIALRYFNAVGARSVRLADRGEANLFPLVFSAFAADRPILVTGGDFPTRDGSGIRDYIHVSDVAEAHVAAVARLDAGAAADAYNVGTGRGYSVLEVISALSELVGREVPYVVAPRRAGDPAEVVADVRRIADELGWNSKRTFHEMVESSFAAWEAFSPSK